MSKIAVIHQPDFAPWLGFFDKLEKADIFIVLDNVQFIRRGWHNRDKIKTPNGVKWLTVPVKKRGNYFEKINNIFINNSEKWKEKHLKTIFYSYKKAMFFNEIFGEIEKIYMKKYEKLINLNVDLIKFFISLFSIKIDVILLSELKVTGQKNQLLVNILKKLGIKKYISGEGAKAYIDENLFKENGIEIIWQKFNHPVYPQLHGPFIPGLSVIDFAMNCGDALKDYIKKHEYKSKS